MDCVCVCVFFSWLSHSHSASLGWEEGRYKELN